MLIKHIGCKTASGYLLFQNCGTKLIKKLTMLNFYGDFVKFKNDLLCKLNDLFKKFLIVFPKFDFVLNFSILDFYLSD